MNSIRNFYSGKTIFITGGSGFMGKVLIEKLLYSCSDLNQIFVLIREKRGKSGFERVNEFSKLPLFERIMKEKPEVMKKMIPVYGDVCEENLGLSASDLAKVLSETQIVFHMAATVQFEAPLKFAVKMNIKGVQTVLNLAKAMPKLLVVEHLSTAFCCADQDVLREEVYDWPMDPKEIINSADTMSEEAMNLMRKTLIPPHPNTYTYTKRLAEILVKNEYPNLPVCIARPSIGDKKKMF
jgi:alcohol-forming fatty acyl-CoA reductase